MTEPATHFRDTVQAFLERIGTAPARLDTADRVLAFMGAATIGPAFRREVEAFLRATRIKLHVLGHDAAGQANAKRPILCAEGGQSLMPIDMPQH